MIAPNPDAGKAAFGRRFNPPNILCDTFATIVHANVNDFIIPPHFGQARVKLPGEGPSLP
jgi:hypothetical protein